MLNAIKDFFSNLFSTSVEVDKPFTYPKYDSNKLKRELSVEKKGKEDGYAFAYREYSKKFIKDENYAKKNNLGFWQTDFELPWEFRKK